MTLPCKLVAPVGARRVPGTRRWAPRWPANGKLATRAFLVWGTSLMLLGSANVRAGEFVFQVDSPKFKITMPSIPSMRMDAHPMHKSQPHLRFLGSNGPYTVSVITPSAAAGMTALECAGATLRSLKTRPGVPPASQIYRARINDSTFVAIYTSPLGGAVQLNAHLLSAAGGTHCIEVYASKISTSEDDPAPWFEGFTNANIEPN
jgi:hypothetical protein